MSKVGCEKHYGLMPVSDGCLLQHRATAKQRDSDNTDKKLTTTPLYAPPKTLSIISSPQMALT